MEQQTNGFPDPEKPEVPLTGDHKDVACGTLRANAQDINADSSTTATSVGGTIEPITAILREQEDDPGQGIDTNILY